VLTGELIENQLEVHIFSNRTPGWCLTCKRPLVSSRGEIRGVIGISRDLGLPDGKHPTYERLRRVLAHMQQHYGEGVRIPALAQLAGLSVAQLERHFRRVFQLTPQQVLTKLRIEAAMRLLSGDDNVASIGMACGFVDQSAFARQFKATVGITPSDYRGMVQRASPIVALR
jgi:transcriptional regulator GlxA family with amidase domain